MIKKLQTKPFYLLLIPLFFLLHTIQENYDLINWRIALRLLGIYLVMIAATYGISYLFFRDYRKTAIITTLWICFFFFFSAFHELLKTYSPINIFGRYVFVLPFSIITLILLFIYLRKTKKRFERFSLLLNCLFVIYILLDLVILGWKSTTPRKYTLSVFDFPEFDSAQLKPGAARPDIYFFVV